MTRRTKPRWTWRIALLLLPLGGWTLALLPDPPPLSDDLAYRVHFQLECGCLLFGAMPKPEPPNDRGRRALASPQIVVCSLPTRAELDSIMFAINCLDARARGFSSVRTRDGTVVIVHQWLAAALLTPGVLPLVGGLRIARRRAVRRRRNCCADCGYDLRGLPAERCPECGSPFVSAVCVPMQESGLPATDVTRVAGAQVNR